MGLIKLISTLVLSGGWSLSIDAFICFKDLANIAAIFSVEAQIYPIFFTRLFWSDLRCVNPLKEVNIFIANGQNFKYFSHSCAHLHLYFHYQICSFVLEIIQN